MFYRGSIRRHNTVTVFYFGIESVKRLEDIRAVGVNLYHLGVFDRLLFVMQYS